MDTSNQPPTPVVRQRRKASIKVDFNLSNPQHRAIYELCRMFNADLLPIMLGYGCEKFKQEMQKALADLNVDQAQLTQSVTASIHQTPSVVAPAAPVSTPSTVEPEEEPVVSTSESTPSESAETAEPTDSNHTPAKTTATKPPASIPAPTTEVFQPSNLPPAGTAGEHVVQNTNTLADSAKRLL